MECYISVIATFIAVCTTFAVGYQMISVFWINSTLKRISKQQEKLDEQMHAQTNLTNESRCLSNGYFILNNHPNVFERGILAFLEYHHSLIYSIEIEHEDYEWLFNIMNGCIDMISKDSFQDRTILGKNQDDEITKKIYEFVKLIDEDEVMLKHSKNFIKIKPYYINMRGKLKTKLEEIRKM